MDSKKSTHHQGQWAKWTGVTVSVVLVALLFKSCADWGYTTQAPKVAPVVANKTAPVTATKLMQLSGANINGKFTLNGVVPTDAVKTQIDAELKKVFGEGNYINNLTVANDVKSPNWLAKLAGFFDFFKLPGSEFTFNGDEVTLSGTAGTLSEKLQALLGNSAKVLTLNVADAAKTATTSAMDALNALKPDASAKDIWSALNLQIINFASGSSAIPADNQAVLKKAAALLKDKKDYKVEIGGHADNTGGVDANLKLSEQRAKSVREFLVKNGVASEAVTAKGYGDTIPVADNSTEAGRFKNRRIEYRMM